MKTMWDSVSDEEGGMRTATQTAKGLAAARRAELQQAFIEGAKFEYERLVLGAPFTRSQGQPPFTESYRQRKERRYAAAAVAYPTPQQPRVLQLDRDKFRFVTDPHSTEGRLQLEEYNEYTDSWRKSDRKFYGWRGADLKALGELAANPTEDAA